MCSMTSLLDGADDNDTYAINTYFGTDYESTSEDESGKPMDQRNTYPGPR
jgi:hypothetical protein